MELTYQNSTDAPLEDCTYPVQVHRALLEIFVAVFGLIGNGMIVFVILTYPKMQSVTNVQILNLSIFDMLILLKPVVFSRFKWFTFPLVCKVYLLFMTAIEFGGTYQLAALSLDRCFALCFPIGSIRYRTLLYSKVICCIVWFLSFSFSLPVSYYGNTIAMEMGCDDICAPFWPTMFEFHGQKVYELFLFLFEFLLPGLTLTVSYVMILLKLSQFRKLETRNAKHIHKVTVFVAIVIGFFLLLWLPFWSIKVLNLLGQPTSDDVEWTTNFITYFHSAFNPLLYAFVNTSFRDSLLQIFKQTKVEEILDVRTDICNLKRDESESKTQESNIGS